MADCVDEEDDEDNEEDEEDEEEEEEVEDEELAEDVVEESTPSSLLGRLLRLGTNSISPVSASIT